MRCWPGLTCPPFFWQKLATFIATTVRTSRCSLLPRLYWPSFSTHSPDRPGSPSRNPDLVSPFACPILFPKMDISQVEEGRRENSLGPLQPASGLVGQLVVRWLLLFSSMFPFVMVKILSFDLPRNKRGGRTKKCRSKFPDIKKVSQRWIFS